jgi:hypothetical protein
MKIRHGFVSNSSSSAFVVAFPTTPKTVQELTGILFADQTQYPNPYPDINFDPERPCIDGWPVEQIAGIVFGDMKKGPLNRDEAIKILSSGYCPDIDSDDFRLPDEQGKLSYQSKVDWKAYSRAHNEWATSAYNELMEKHPNALLYGFEYSDNDGDLFCAMEHGGLFAALPHIRISHH